MTTPEFVEGLRAFADRYEGFVLDQWGVLHDGQNPYPDALPATVELIRRNKQIVLLSNSGKRADDSREHLASMGYNIAAMRAVVTSGEAAWRMIHDRLPPADAWGRKCFFLTRFGDMERVAGLDIELVERSEEADFIFLSAVDAPEVELEEYQSMLEPARAKQIPMLCGNPDMQSPYGDILILAPGTIAEWYAQGGAPVHYVGKPYAPIYGACFDAMPDLRPQEIVCIGDSLAHDILGGRDAGCATCLITAGVHEPELPRDQSRAAAVKALDALAKDHGVMPDYVMPSLVW